MNITTTIEEFLKQNAESENEKIDLSQFEEQDHDLQIKLQMKRKTIDLDNDHDINKLVNFFNNKKKFDLRKQTLF